jgi:acyl-CoA oxidase
VEPDGTYVKHSSGGDKKKKRSDDNDKLQYITMMKTRIALTSTAAGSLAKACTIAVRYAAVREQGFKDSRAGQSHLAQEWQIIDYQTQLFRLVKWTSTAYAFKFVARWLLDLRRGVEAGTVDAAELPSVHAASSGLKGLTCKLASDGIEDLRRSCGGHGYLLASGIAALEADFKYNATAEGDFVVLLLQTARYLLKSRDMARAGEPLAGIVSGLAPLKVLICDALFFFNTLDLPSTHSSFSRT